MTNNPWIIRPAMLQDELGLDRMMLMNDFGAVAHAVAHFGREHFVHVCGPEVDLPAIGTISVVGPGTGLGVAGLLRSKDHYHVLETEGGHIEFAALDTIEEAIVTRLRARHGRVSAERIVSGSGLQTIYEVLAERDGEAVAPVSNPELWQRALDSHSPLATEALERFCRSLGSIAGDIALVHGASALVIAGGLGLRLAKSIKGSGFAGRFLEKGRYLSLMETIPVHLVTHTQPGLFGAAAAFAASSTDGASGY